MGKSKKVGRPVKTRKRTGPEPIAPAAWERIRREAERGALDKIHGSELGRLSYAGQITSIQFAAGNRVGQIYGCYERRCVGKGRSARSPSYESGFTGIGGVDVISFALNKDGKSPEEIAADTRQSWKDLQAKLEDFSVRAKTLLESLCVEDRPVTTEQLYLLRPTLDELAAGHFQIVGAGKNTKRNSALRDGATDANSPQQSPERKNLDLVCFRSAVGKLCENIEPDQVYTAFEDYHARRARMIYEAQKDRARKNSATMIHSRG